MPCFGKFGPKTQYCEFKLKFGTKTNSNMQKLMVMSLFSAFEWKYSNWINLIKNIKVFGLSRNLVPRLIEILIIQWHCSLFLF